MSKITRITLVDELKSLGVDAGDTVFIAADLLKVGYFVGNREKTLSAWVEILLEVVGSEGTLVIPAYTDTFWRFKKQKNIVFSSNSRSISGALSLAFQNYPEVQRSRHPTNSCFAIGPDAKHILGEHDTNSSTYFPYHRVIELGGKNLMIGTFADDRLAPMTMHAAQEVLGETERNWASGLLQSFYIGPCGEVELFTKRGVGGCTSGGYKALGHHFNKASITVGRVGRSTSALIDCKKSLDIFIDILKTEPELIRCNNSNCPDCYGSPIINHPFFWFKQIARKGLRLIRS
jgi:aminoglycoside N3'-acetyltransferase